MLETYLAVTQEEESIEYLEPNNHELFKSLESLYKNIQKVFLANSMECTGELRVNSICYRAYA